MRRWLLLLILLLMPVVLGEAPYTREHSEDLMHLIEWRPYHPATFAEALEEGKPVYLVISAPAWCYWCHVYESEDYLFHPSLYPVINKEFIPIFVDSDKRPDLTKKYLEGGWPSTTVLTPNLLRVNGFSGPREPIGLRDYLLSVVEFLKGQDFSSYALEINYQRNDPVTFEYKHLEHYQKDFVKLLVGQYDKEFGGLSLGNLPEWREGQKFPKPLALKHLLSSGEHLDVVVDTFKHQFTSSLEAYHLYDPIEGGFHRYSTKRDWTIPHYEKMIGDQARFLMLLEELYAITSDEDVQTALDGTLAFVRNEFTDPSGGFYSSADAHLEDEYFGKDSAGRAEMVRPYVDHTKIMDGNMLMVKALLRLDKESARKALDFVQENMISDGALYYYDAEKREASLSGQSVANAFALWGFIEGYEVVGDDAYLATAENIALFSLDRLYDWNVGGFFNRNSDDKEFYAPNERIDLGKPYRENAVFALGLLKLYLATDNVLYLDAGLKTMGYTLQLGGGFDESYYTLEAASLVKKHILLDVDRGGIAGDVLEFQEGFWLDDYLASASEAPSLEGAPVLPNEFSGTSFLLLALVAFLVGILSFLSPCTLPVLTAYFAQSLSAKRGEILRHTLSFFFGLALIFSAFGMGATYLGILLRDSRLLLTHIAGLVIIFFGVLQLFGKGFSGLHVKIKGRKTYFGSFLFGVVFGVGWSACIGPILASVLVLSATTGTIVEGSSLLFIYALGLALPLIMLSFMFDKIKDHAFWNFLQGSTFTLRLFGRSIVLHTAYVISGVFLIAIGILIYQDYLYSFNELALQTPIVQEIIIKGEEWLKGALLP